MTEGKSGIDGRLVGIEWTLAFLTFGVGDTATTMVVLGRRNFLGETNPVVRAAVAEFGFPGFLALKAIAFLVALGAGLYFYRVREDRFLAYVIPILVIVAGLFTTVSNLQLVF